MEAARILVVDDSLTIRRALEFILKPRGYALEFAADGREALDRAGAFRPDLVLLDYVLPDMRGPDVCSALAAIPVTAQTPVILVSAKGATIRQAYQDAHNVVSYVTKPFKPQVVLSVVENALQRGQPASPVPVAAPPAEDAPAIARRGLPALRTPTLEETFSALLGQLEDAVSAETGREVGARSLARLDDPLRRAREHLREIGQHLGERGVAPYRLRPDGSFANVAATLLEAHRLLCEATLALAASGGPGPELPRPPAVVVAAPRGRPGHEALEELLGTRSDVLLVERELASLPWIVSLTKPDLLVAVPGVDMALDEALRRVSAEVERRVLFVAPDVPFDASAWPGFETVDRVEAIAAALESAPAPETPADLGFEVVTL